MLCVFCTLLSFSQTSFSNEPPVFIDEFTKYMSVNADAELKIIIENFSKNWKTNKIPDEQKTYIIKITNSMMYKSLPKDPYLDLLIKDFDLYYQKKLNPAILKQWMEITKTLLDKNPKDYQSFLLTVYDLFKDNTLVRNDKRRWFASNANFEFVIEKNRIGIRYKQIDLICKAAVDEIKIIGTSGTYYPDKKIWVGDKGKINWLRVGKPETEIYCEFNKHRVDLNSTGFSVDSAILFYPKVSSTRLVGKLTEQVSNSSSAEEVKTSVYPQFISYDPTIEIKDVVGNQAVYKGGFSIKGTKTSSQNFGEGKGSVTLLYNGKPMVIAESKSFKLDSNKVFSTNAAIKIKVDTGWITHPGVFFTYNIAQKKMTINKGTEGLMRVPFSDNYHGVEIDVDQVRWDQKMPFIEFDMTNNEKTAYVETNTFFKKFLFDKYQGALSINPLEKMFRYAQSNGRSFKLTDYASAINSKKELLNQMVMDMADDGFLYYYPENDSVYVRDRLYMWNSSALGGRDYDVLRFGSVIAAKPNITYSFKSHELMMLGVRRFTFSDSQNVLAIPNDQVLTIRKDKGLQFSGMIRAGRIDFYSKDFNFDYRNFQINNTTIDSMVIFYPDENTNSLRKVESVLANTYGRILIDKPNNKSGLKDYPEYPIFIAERGSEITYDRAQTHNHAYNADRFKFEVDPFVIDSLDDFTIAGFGFGGTLVSDGIFPDIKNVARIQPDYSLGFVDHVELPMYGGKGKGDLTINLSNRGFYGTGDLLYETSVSKSTEYLLLPDATVGNSFSFRLPESAKYPVVEGHNVRTEWYPKQDKMFQTKLDSNFKVFKMGYDFEGKLTLSPKDLRGDGNLKWNEAIFSSQEMVYGRNKATADVCSIKIFAVDPSKFAFESSNMKGVVDFDKREGKFLTNVTGTLTNFPYNRYASNMNDYLWNMSAKTMEIKPGPAMGTLKPIFVGLPENAKDSVKFECHYAKYDLVANVINMEKIPYIDIADSRVYPFEGKAVVREKADMDPLMKSRIEANRNDKFHEIKDCRTKILGGNNLASAGYYRYIDKYKAEQPLYVDSIRIDTAKHLVGYGNVPDSNILKLDKKIGYKGAFKIISTKKPIEFLGYVKPLHKFVKMETLWLRYHNSVDPQNVIIDVRDPRDKDKNKLSVGLYFANDSNHVYPIMFDLKRRYSDPELQSDTGILFYDEAKDAFMIGDEGKLKGNSVRGNYIQFNDKDQSVYCEGNIDFRINAPKVSVKSAGTANHSATDSTFRFNLMMWFDFPFASDIKDKMQKIFLGESAGSAAGSMKTGDNKMGIAEIISDQKTGDRMMKTLDNSGSIPAEGEFKTGILLTDVEIAFDRIKRKFISTGPITVALMNGNNVSKKFTGTIAIEKRRTGDKIYIYLINDQGDWVYLEYFRNTMTIATNNADLLNAVNTESMKMNDEQFMIKPGTERMKDNFLKRNDVEEE